MKSWISVIWTSAMLATSLLCAGVFAHAEELKIYMLREPIEQEQLFTGKSAATLIGAETAKELALAMATAFAGSHHHHHEGAAILMFAHGAVSLAMKWPLEKWAWTELWAFVHRNQGLKSIATLEGVKSVRVLTSGHFTNTSVMKGALSSKSFVFVSASGRPAAVQGNEWIEISHPGDAHLDLTFKIDGKETGPKIKMPLLQLMDPERGNMPAEELEIWEKEFSRWENEKLGRDLWAQTKHVLKENDWQLFPSDLDAWERQRPEWRKTWSHLIDRHFSHKSVNEGIAIDGKLSINGTELALNDFAVGHGAEKLMRNSLLSKVLLWLQDPSRVFSKEPLPKAFATRNSRVYDQSARYSEESCPGKVIQAIHSLTRRGFYRPAEAAIIKKNAREREKEQRLLDLTRERD